MGLWAIETFRLYSIRPESLLMGSGQLGVGVEIEMAVSSVQVTRMRYSLTE